MEGEPIASSPLVARGNTGDFAVGSNVMVKLTPRNRRSHPRQLVCAVLLGGLCLVLFYRQAAAGAISRGRVGNAEIVFDAGEGLGGLEATVNGVTFRPLAGAAALGRDGEPTASIPLTVDATVADGVLRLTITAPKGEARGIDPGLVEGLGEWRRLDLSRYAQHYGQVWWPKTVYSVEGDFWFTAHWVMEQSDGTTWKATNQSNRGSGPFPAALEVEYSPDTRGDYLPIHEVLELRFSSHLWDVVPKLRQKPSEYREFLAGSLFVDLWRGDDVSEMMHFLRVLKAIGRGRLSYNTILQNWGAGGFDALLPDSIWLPEYPPNPAVGTVAELRELCELGKSMGRFGFRTNYVSLQEGSPSFRRKLARYAVEADGKPRSWTRPADWLAVARRGDTEIQKEFAPNASFTDQITSGAAPWSWHDYAAEGGTRSMRRTLDHQKALARLIKGIHRGPLGSESLIDQHLLGEFIDTGDFGISNAHRRLVSPEYKLRRLHGLTGFHGMGLVYRFFESPPFKDFHAGVLPFMDDPMLLDDYRACEILFGNGGYVCYGYGNWTYFLTECLLVGNLQKHYSARSVREVYYWHDGEWVSLEDFVRKGNVPNIIPWLPQTEAYGRIRVDYENGLRIVVNRLDEEFMVAGAGENGVLLPRSGWVAWRDAPALIAFSAFWPGTRHRVDYLQDEEAELEYLDPRGRRLRGVSNISLWDGGEIVVSAEPDRNIVTVDGESIELSPPPVAPRKTLDFEFDEGVGGWRLTRGIVRGEARRGLLHLAVVAPDVYIFSPPLEVDGDKISAIEIRMKITGDNVKSDGLYFTTREYSNVAGDKRVGFAVEADGRFHNYQVNVGGHAKWRGQTITGLRLDPISGSTNAKIEIDYIRGIAEISVPTQEAPRKEEKRR